MKMGLISSPCLFSLFPLAIPPLIDILYSYETLKSSWLANIITNSWFCYILLELLVHLFDVFLCRGSLILGDYSEGQTSQIFYALDAAKENVHGCQG